MKTQALHITIRLWALLLIVGLCACNPWEQPEEEKDIPLAIFKTFWEQMDKHYTCFEEHPVNWDSIYYTNISQVNELQNTEDLVPIFQSILNTLKDPQLWIGVPQKASIQYRLNGSLESLGRTPQKEKPRLTKLMQLFKIENAIWKYFIILERSCMVVCGKSNPICHTQTFPKTRTCTCWIFPSVYVMERSNEISYIIMETLVLNFCLIIWRCKPIFISYTY